MPRIVLTDLETEKPLAVADLEATLGRDPACGFFIEGPKSRVVSGRHARISFQDNSWWIEDTSRNGTVLDNERLQAGQRHAIRVGQVIGLGESGPRLRVAVLESRKVAETLMEHSDVDAPPPPPKLKTTAPRQPAVTSHKPAAAAEVSEGTMAMRRSEAQRAGVRMEEPTEPMSPAPDWLVQVVLVATNTNKKYDVTSMAVKLGRSPECNVQVPPELGASVSRLHAEIAIQDGGVVVRDAGSRNGTFVNGRRLDAPHPAAKNDLIMLGSGGPTFSIEDLHIVKGPTSPSEPPGGGGRGEATPVEPKPSKGSGKPLEEPLTDPTPLARAKGALKADVLEDMSQTEAKRLRVVVWASVIATVAIAVVVLAVA